MGDLISTSSCHCKLRVTLVSSSMVKRRSHCNSSSQGGFKHMQGFEQQSIEPYEDYAQVEAVQKSRRYSTDINCMSI